MEKEEGYFVDITDEEGNNFKLEIVGDVEYEDELYRVFLPTDMDEDDPDYGFIILKCTQVGDEEMLDRYKEAETFTDYKLWNEYQTTGFVPFSHEGFDRDDVRKKFRIWRLAVPRALKEGTNRYGLDRIRNPWVNLLFRKEGGDPRNLMQLHDIVVKYFE